MKKYLIIVVIIVALIIIGIFLFDNKPCTELNEEECKTADGCVSTLIPCTGHDCISDAVFKECKDK